MPCLHKGKLSQPATFNYPVTWRWEDKTEDSCREDKTEDSWVFKQAPTETSRHVLVCGPPPESRVGACWWTDAGKASRLTWGDGIDPEEARVVVARVERRVRVAYLPRRHGQRLPQGRDHVGAWADHSTKKAGGGEGGDEVYRTRTCRGHRRQPPAVHTYVHATRSLPSNGKLCHP